MRSTATRAKTQGSLARRRGITTGRVSTAAVRDSGDMMPSDRDDEGTSRHRVVDDVAADAEHLLHELGVEHLRGCPARDDASLAHGDALVGVASGQVEV